MLFAQPRKFNRTVTGVLTVFALAVASALVFAAVPGSVIAGSSHARNVSASRAERSNHRISVRPQASVARRTLTTNAAVPFFATDRR